MSSDLRHGEIDPEQLFDITDITEEVLSRLPNTEQKIREAFEYLDTIPVPSLMDYCTENKLNCRFLKMHFPGLPDYTVFDITFLKNDKRRQLLSDGIIDVRDVPDDFRLSDKQRTQVEVAKTGKTFIDREKILDRICSWTYPLHFLDYETFAYAIPQYDGLKPFQQMCFQYSLHTIDEPGGEMTHNFYLSRGEGEPARDLAAHLQSAMSGGIGTVFVWYEAFEKSRNQEMGEMYPEFKEFFDEVNSKTCDLMKVFSDGLYIHPDFKGRTSIKKVLPVLCPELSYKELGIGDGMTASISWFRAAKWTTLPQDQRDRIFADLEKYCELDTLAMVRIFDVLRSV